MENCAILTSILKCCGAVRSQRVKKCVFSHHKLLLCASHAGASLCVLVCSDQQLNQSWDGSLLPQWSVICRAQSQITDQTNRSLMEEHSQNVNFRSPIALVGD